MDKEKEEFLAYLRKLPPERLKIMRNFMWLIVNSAGFRDEFDRLFPLDGSDPDWNTVDELVQKWIRRESESAFTERERMAG